MLFSVFSSGFCSFGLGFQGSWVRDNLCPFFFPAAEKRSKKRRRRSAELTSKPDAALAKTAFHSAATKKLTLAASFSFFVLRCHSWFGLFYRPRCSDSFCCGRSVPGGFLTPGLLRAGSTAWLPRVYRPVVTAKALVQPP